MCNFPTPHCMLHGRCMNWGISSCYNPALTSPPYTYIASSPGRMLHSPDICVHTARPSSGIPLPPIPCCTDKLLSARHTSRVAPCTLRDTFASSSPSQRPQHHTYTFQSGGRTSLLLCSYLGKASWSSHRPKSRHNSHTFVSLRYTRPSCYSCSCKYTPYSPLSCHPSQGCTCRLRSCRMYRAHNRHWDSSLTSSPCGSNLSCTHIGHYTCCICRGRCSCWDMSESCPSPHSSPPDPSSFPLQLYRCSYHQSRSCPQNSPRRTCMCRRWYRTYHGRSKCRGTVSVGTRLGKAVTGFQFCCNQFCRRTHRAKNCKTHGRCTPCLSPDPSEPSGTLSHCNPLTSRQTPYCICMCHPVDTCRCHCNRSGRQLQRSSDHRMALRRHTCL